MDSNEDRNGIHLLEPNFYCGKVQLEIGTVFADASNESVIWDVIQEILRKEAPISRNLLIKRLAEAFDITDNIEIGETADCILDKNGIKRIENLQGERTVLLSDAMNVNRYSLVRQYSSTKRSENISELSEKEVCNALTYCYNGMDKDENVIKDAFDLMGYKTVPEEIRPKVENILREVKRTVKLPELPVDGLRNALTRYYNGKEKDEAVIKKAFCLMGYKTVPEEFRLKAERILREVKRTFVEPPRGENDNPRSEVAKAIENRFKVFRTSIPPQEQAVFTPGEFQHRHLTVDFYNISDEGKITKLVNMLEKTSGISLSDTIGRKHEPIPGDSGVYGYISFTVNERHPVEKFKKVLEAFGEQNGIEPKWRNWWLPHGVHIREKEVKYRTLDGLLS